MFNDILKDDKLKEKEELEANKEVAVVEIVDNATIKELAIENKGSIELDVHDAGVIENRIKAINNVANAIKTNLIDGIDYGVVPKTTKPTLFKAGASKIMLMYGLRSKFTMEENVNREEGYVEANFKCELIDGNNNFIAEGYGHASTREDSRKTQNPWNIRNTVLKVAEKRAMVDAVLKIGNLSAVMTQDMEDNSLSTTSAAQNLTKDDKLKLYGLAYTHWEELMAKGKNKTEGKDIIKAHLTKEVFPKLELPSNFMKFEANHRQIFLDYINGGGK